MQSRSHLREVPLPRSQDYHTPVVIIDEHGIPKIEGKWFVDLDGPEIRAEINALLKKAQQRWTDNRHRYVDAEALAKAIF